MLFMLFIPVKYIKPDITNITHATLKAHVAKEWVFSIISL